MGMQPLRKSVWFVQIFNSGERMIIPSSSQHVADIQERHASRSLKDVVPETYETSKGWRSWVHAETTNEAIGSALEKIQRKSMA